MKKVRFFDSTLRDGSHAVAHQINRENIEQYCSLIDHCGLYTVVVGHGNGLGASSLQVGLSLLKDEEMISCARQHLKKTKLGVYMIPGFGTIKDDLEPSIELGVDLFKIGCHCTEADTTKQHIEYLVKKEKEVYGILMMYHMASAEKIVEEVKKMASYGAEGVILMDSSGTSTPEMVRSTISLLKSSVEVKIGFHPHNNLSMAVANAYVAIKEGADIIDGTLRGFGAGAGNCQLESIVAVCEKEHIETGIDIMDLLDVSEKVMPSIMNESIGQDPLSIVSGLCGVFSAFKVHVIRAAEEFSVDPKKIYLELGKRKAVGGQEDMIIEIAQKLAGDKGNKRRI